MKYLFALLWLASIALLGGCATPNPDQQQESDIPWAAPQPWEGAPGIPGLETR
jgi:hypothetical protein